MAPELHLKKSYDGKVDIWAIGVIYYYMLVGKLPFKGIRLYDLENNRIEDDPVFPKSKFISSRSQKLILKLLEKNPDNRYTTKEVLFLFYKNEIF